MHETALSEMKSLLNAITAYCIKDFVLHTGSTLQIVVPHCTWSTCM